MGYQPGLQAHGDRFPRDRVGPDFTGTADPAGDTIILTVPLDALGNPHVIRIGAWTYRVPNAPRGRWGDPWDTIPDSDLRGATGDWLVLGS